MVMTLGGIPLIYLGDEIGTLNDYSYLDNPAHKDDSRWVHRPKADWKRYAKRHDPTTIEGQVYARIQAIIAFRKTHPELAGGELETIESGNPSVLAFSRAYQDSPRLVIFANFSEQEQMVSARVIEQNNLPGKQRLFGESTLSVKDDLILPPLDFAIFG